MKTAKQTNGNFPRPGRLSLYICAVVVMCFFNWVALNAQSDRKENNMSSQLAIALAEEDEPAVQLQAWMMDFGMVNLAENEEPELKVEPWMLCFSLDHMAGDLESEIGFEPWMVNFEERCLVVDDEVDFALEDWMFNTCTWECAVSLMARK